MLRGCIEIKEEEETLCWDCQNYARCSWADGVPVEGWSATPTKIYHSDGIIDSFLVKTCPMFKADTKRAVTTQELGDMLGFSRTHVARMIRTRGGFLILRAKLREHGYKLYSSIFPIEGGERRDFCIEKIEDKGGDK